MAIEVLDSTGNILRVKIKGEFKKTESDHIQRIAESTIKQRGKIKTLIILEDFQGWERGADWGDISFAIEHDDDIEKMAIVGDEEWKDLVFAFLAQPLRRTQIEYFDSTRIKEASAWIE
jgi:hypothetical protein